MTVYHRLAVLAARSKIALDGREADHQASLCQMDETAGDRKCEQDCGEETSRAKPGEE
jgi:hypothetical protein